MQVRDSVVGNASSPVKTYTAQLPSYAAGDRVIIQLSSQGATPPPAPAGWERLNARPRNMDLAFYVREMDGSEGSSVDFVLNPTHDLLAAHKADAITGHDPGAAVAYTLPGGTQGAAADCPANSFPWGAYETLVIAVVGWRWGAGPVQVLSTYPSTYDDSQGNAVASGVQGVGVASCSHVTSSSADNPGSFTFTGTVATTTHTLAIKGA